MESDRWGHRNGDCSRALIQTADGGFALAGDTESFGAGGKDMFLVKTDANGVAQWYQTYGGTEWDWAFALVQTTDGEFALAGRTSSYGAGNVDMWLVKTGTPTFTTETTTLTTETTESSVISDEDRGLIIRGYFDGLDDILLRDDEIWIHHKTFGEPESLRLNGFNWEPHFPNGGYDVDSYSNPLIGHTLLPMNETICSLNIIEKPDLGTVTISQNPANENDFTLIITVDDRPTMGGYWYEFRVPCAQYKGSKGISGFEPLPMLATVVVLVYWFKRKKYS